MFLHKWILNPQNLPQNRSLETVRVCIVLQCYRRNNTVCIHMYDECNRSNDPGVCHRLWSISCLWCLKYPHSTRNIFIGKLKCVAQPKPLGDQGYHSQIYLSISINISHTVRWAPPFRPSVASQSIRCLCCHFAHQRRHKRNQSLTRNVIRDQEEHHGTGLLRPFSALFHLLQESHHFSSWFFLPTPGALVGGSRLSLPCKNLDAFSRSHFFSLGKTSSNCFKSSFFQNLFPCSASFRHIANALPILSPLPRSGPSAWHPLPPFAKICTPPLHAAGLVILCTSPALPSALLIVWLTFSWCISYNFPIPSFSSSLPANHTISENGFFPSCLEPSFLTIHHQQLTDPPTAVGIHSFFCSNFLRDILHNLHSMLPFQLFSPSSSLHEYFAYAAGYILWTKRKFLPNNLLSPFVFCTSIPTQRLSFAVVHLVLVHELFLDCLHKLLPTLIHLFLTHRSPNDHLLRLFRQRAARFVLRLFNGPSFHFFLFF